MEGVRLLEEVKVALRQRDTVPEGLPEGVVEKVGEREALAVCVGPPPGGPRAREAVGDWDALGQKVREGVEVGVGVVPLAPPPVELSVPVGLTLNVLVRLAVGLREELSDEVHVGEVQGEGELVGEPPPQGGEGEAEGVEEAQAQAEGERVPVAEGVVLRVPLMVVHVVGEREGLSEALPEPQGVGEAPKRRLAVAAGVGEGRRGEGVGPAALPVGTAAVKVVSKLRDLVRIVEGDGAPEEERVALGENESTRLVEAASEGVGEREGQSVGLGLRDSVGEAHWEAKGVPLETGEGDNGGVREGEGVREDPGDCVPPRAAAAPRLLL